jgi:Domain of unknown function (DUF4185)
MSPFGRIASVPVASAAAIGLVVSIVVAPPSTAEPCTGAAAEAQPPAAPNTAATPALPGLNGPPIGHRPRKAQDRAPLPNLGRLSRSILNSFMPQSARVQQQAGVVPPPAPPPVPDAVAIAQPAPPPAPPPGPAPAPAPAPGPPPGTSLVGWVTGPNSPNDTIKRFAITGTDLGIMWDNGDPVNNQVLMAFGDTIGYCSVRGKQWRYNTMFRTNDRVLSKTVSIPNGVVNNKYSGSPLWAPALSKQVINSIRFAPSETGIIPTSGIAVGKTQYMSFMSIRSWDSPGSWTTNFSAIAVSPDNGEHWGVYPQSVRPASPDATPRISYVPGGEKFQVGAFLKPGDGYLYSYGTPSGRGGAAFVSRVPQGLVPELSRYEYWDGGNWVPKDPGAAQPVIPAPVGEMSVQYNTYLKQFLALYCNGNNDVVARTAPSPQGPWGPEQMLVSSWDFPGGIYAPLLHPWSTGKELYYNLSLWSDYNVMLMKTVLP